MRRHGEHVEARLFMPSGIYPIDYVASQKDCEMMDLALEEAQKAADVGDSPIGSVLVHPYHGIFPAHTTEFVDKDLLGHAEQNSYKAAREKVGRDLGECILYTTAEPCFQCAYMLDKGGLGALHVAAMRTDAPDFFRRRGVIEAVWSNSRRNLTVISGLRKAKAVELLTADNKKH